MSFTPMRILALESTTEACSVALYNDGRIVEKFEVAPRQHTSLLLKMVDSLLFEEGVSKHELDAIAFCRGPGAFTGLRIAIGVAQGLGFGLNIPLIPISSLAALAQGGLRHSEIHGENAVFLSCLDARKNEVFWARYSIQDGYATLDGDEYVSTIEKVAEILNGIDGLHSSYLVIGTGTSIIKKLNEPKLNFVDSIPDKIHYPHAYDVASLAVKEYRLGNMVKAEQAVPVYLRNNVTN